MTKRFPNRDISLIGNINLCLVLLFSSATSFAESPISAFKQEFSLTSSGIPFSIKAERKLAYHGDGHWQMNISADNWLGKVKETTIFSWQQCLPQSTYYGYKRSGLGKKRHAEMFFNHESGQARILRASKEKHYDIAPDTTDKLSQTLALQCMLSRGDTTLALQIADERGVDDVMYKKVGEETIKTPAGKFATVKLERVREAGSSRQTSLWFARDYAYALVKMVQKEDDKQHTMVLRRVSH